MSARRSVREDRVAAVSRSSLQATDVGGTIAANQSPRRLLFLAFFFSGLAGLVYQVVWTRLAFAAFGIITPVLSVVISVFMLGLSVGAWLGGKLLPFLKRRTGRSGLALYVGAELLIGVGAFVVPGLFSAGERFLLTSGETSSARYLTLSAIVLALSILPFCLCMGTTFPFMMDYVRERRAGSADSFSYLYTGNVLGAMAGALAASLVLVELLGFRKTLLVAAVGNGLAAALCLWHSRSAPQAASARRRATESAAPITASGIPAWQARGILFATGFSSMAMEVIWTRAFTPVLKTQVYSFALILFAYLATTFLGSVLYRRDLRRGRLRTVPVLLAVLAVSVLLPVLVNDIRLLRGGWALPMHVPSVLIVLASIGPLCAVLGYLTPRLIDGAAAGEPAAAGKAYALNVLGCILGPLCASYVLLPVMSERHALLWVSVPCLAFYAVSFLALGRWRVPSAAVVCGALGFGIFLSRDYETSLTRFDPATVVRRDYAASVMSSGSGFRKNLLINGIGMTVLTPITKLMLHLPATLHRDCPRSALIICFGMGTTFRSSLSWGFETTAVELVPGVTRAFEFYHDDAAIRRSDPKGRIVVDDGRRFLSRTRQKFDVIVIDPPPPIEAAGSSLLYSLEFYALAKERLNPGGIVQAWFPSGDAASLQAVLRAVRESFPHVRCFGSIEGWGIHMLGSMDPIEVPPIDDLLSRMPESAKADLMEWTPAETLPNYFGRALSLELPVPKLLGPNPPAPITDDLPSNEYFLLRRMKD